MSKKLKTEELTIATVLRGKNLEQKYRAIDIFLNSTFPVTNTALPQFAKNNEIMGMVVLRELKELVPVVEEDIQGLTIKDIDVNDIVGDKENEISRLIHSLLCGYPYTGICNDYKVYKKYEKLNEVFPIEARKLKVEQLKGEIDRVQKSIETIMEVDSGLAKSYISKKADLEREYNALQETLYCKSLAEIRLQAYGSLIYRLENFKEVIENKIEFLERVLGE